MSETWKLNVEVFLEGGKEIESFDSIKIADCDFFFQILILTLPLGSVLCE